jgi:hypothetical protein
MHIALLRGLGEFSSHVWLNTAHPSPTWKKSPAQSEITSFIGSKDKAADQLCTENRILIELGVAAVETIERMDEEIELKDNKINVLEKEQKIQTLLNKKPVIRNNNKERAKRRLLNTLSLTL